MSLSHNLIHVIEFFPILLATIIIFMGIRNDFILDKGSALLIVMTACFYLATQLTWWYIHFFNGVQRIPQEFQIAWAGYDFAAMLVFIHLLRRK